MGVSFSTTSNSSTSTPRRRTTITTNHQTYLPMEYNNYNNNIYPQPYLYDSHPSSYSNNYHLQTTTTSFYNNICNHPNNTNSVVMGHPYFPHQFQIQQPPPPPPTPVEEEEEEEGELKVAKVVNSDVNVHKDSFMLEVDEIMPDHYLLSFVFDALLDGSITIFHFAREEPDRRVVPLFPEAYVPIKVPFRKGLNQQFRQPLGTGIALDVLALGNLSNPTARDDVYPIVVSADTCAPSYMVDDRSYLSAHAFPQVQISQVAVMKNNEGQYTPKVIRQLLWTDNICYELREIYGLGKSGSSINDNGSGKECVICMTDPKDIAVLPCRHMCMCSSCAKALKLQSNKCPICREVIESLLEIKIDDIDDFQ